VPSVAPSRHDAGLVRVATAFIGAAVPLLNPWSRS
jgi:hypothetical protein